MLNLRPGLHFRKIQNYSFYLHAPLEAECDVSRSILFSIKTKQDAHSCKLKFGIKHIHVYMLNIIIYTVLAILTQRLLHNATIYLKLLELFCLYTRQYGGK